MQQETINILVKSTGEEDIKFKIKKTTMLKKLMQRYCERLGVQDHNTVNFIYNGNRISETDTAIKLNMGEDEEIHCVTTQIGG